MIKIIKSFANFKQERQWRWMVYTNRICIKHNLVDESKTVGDQMLMKPRKCYQGLAHQICAHSES